MLARIRKSMDEKDRGFTLIELLVVMIIIGILAAIAVPVFINQRKKAVDSSIKSDLRTIANAEESNATDAAYVLVDDYTAAGASVPVPNENDPVNVSPGNYYRVQLLSDKDTYTHNPDAVVGFCIQGRSAKGTDPNHGWVYNSLDGGLKQGTPDTDCP